MTAYLFAIAYRINKLMGAVLRVRGHKAYSEIPRQRVYAPQKLRKADTAVQPLAVGIYILPQKGYFPVPCGNHFFSLGNYRLRLPRALAPPYIRHYAVGAEIIAAVHYRQPALEGTVPFYRNALWYFLV